MCLGWAAAVGGGVCVLWVVNFKLFDVNMTSPFRNLLCFIFLCQISSSISRKYLITL